MMYTLPATAALALLLFGHTACSQNKPAGNTPAAFPTIAAQTLSQKDIVFPDVVKGEYAFIAVAFKMRAQGQIDSWYDVYLDSLKPRGVVFYEIPMIAGSWKMMSGWIDGGMRGGIPPEKHPYVATYYGPLDKLQQELGTSDDQLAYVYLLDPESKVLFMGKHFATPEQVRALMDAAP
jgi:hypothetical protein